MDKIETSTEKSKDIVAYFDFDGTLTRYDTLILFLLHCVGLIRFILNIPRLLPVVLLYLFKIITNEKAKELAITILIKGKKTTWLQNKAEQFALNKLDHYIKPEIYKKLEYHIEHGHTIVLVSANLAMYLRYFALKHNIDIVIATELQFKDGICTGKLATRNCYGIQKVKRLNEYLKQHELTFSYSYGYGNSRGDYELLNYVNEAYWIIDDQIISWSDYSGRADS